MRKLSIVLGTLLASFCSWVTASNPSSTPAPAEGAATYELPAVWRGTANGSREGNPLTSDGVPRWRLDHIWPDVWKEPENFKPLMWKGASWGLLRRSEGEQMGRPDASVTSEGVRLSAFASRLGTDTSRAQFSNKAAVLVFIAPQDGLYSISGSAEMTISSGAGPGRMMILKHDQQARRIRKLADEILTPEVTLKLVDFRVKLGATDEIMIFPWNDKDKDGSELMLRNLAVARLGSP